MRGWNGGNEVKIPVDGELESGGSTGALCADRRSPLSGRRVKRGKKTTRGRG